MYLSWKDPTKLVVLNENWFAFEESRKVHDADCSFVTERVSKQVPEYEGQTVGEMRLKWYKEFNERDPNWNGPYPTTGLDCFIKWYQIARGVVEDEEAKYYEDVLITDSIRAMAGKLSDRDASEAALIHALYAQLETPAARNFISKKFGIIGMSEDAPLISN